jgi:Sec-independent protein translocase protein TatA
MSTFSSISERRQLRTAKLKTVTAGMSIQEALRMAASMTPEQQKKFVEEHLAAMGKSKIQFLASQAGEAIRKVKDVFKKKDAAFDGMMDVKDKKDYGNTGPMATRNEGPSSQTSSMLKKISNVFGVATVILLMGGMLMGLFEPENQETITQLKPILVTFGAGAISLLTGIAASKTN